MFRFHAIYTLDTTKVSVYVRIFERIEFLVIYSYRGLRNYLNNPETRYDTFNSSNTSKDLDTLEKSRYFDNDVKEVDLRETSTRILDR